MFSFVNKTMRSVAEIEVTMFWPYRFDLKIRTAFLVSNKTELWMPTSDAKMFGSNGRLVQFWLSYTPMLLFTRTPFNFNLYNYLHLIYLYCLYLRVCVCMLPISIGPAGNPLSWKLKTFMKPWMILSIVKPGFVPYWVSAS